MESFLYLLNSNIVGEFSHGYSEVYGIVVIESR